MKTTTDSRRRPRASQPRALLHAVALFAFAAAALSGGCAVNPVTGKRDFILMTESQEKALGKQADEQIVAQYGLVDDPSLQAYVESVTAKLVPVSHRPELGFTFRVLDDPVVNAFALPGGYVYITRGILAYLEDEAAMAGVLGHEIGHVTARHGAKQYTKQTLLGLGIGIGSVVSEKFAQYSGLAGGAAQLLLLKYSRDDERQADQLGVEYATRSGYDTEEMARFFHTLQQLTAGGQRLPAWQSTHPDPGERFETVTELTSEWQQKVGDASYETDRDRFLEHIDGIVFGQNPRHGYVKDGEFRHPDLALRFPVPTGWQVANMASEVQLAPSDGRAAVIFSVAADATDPATAAESFVSSSGVQVVERGSVTVGGFSGTRLDSRATGQDGSMIAVLSTFVAVDGQVFVFHGLAAAADYPTYASALRSVEDGFARLTDPEALSIQPVAVRVIRAPHNGTFQEIVAGHPIPDGVEMDLAGLALMNEMEIDSPVSSGDRIKVLERP
jgi:predicted Zn-dependent protease